MVLLKSESKSANFTWKGFFELGAVVGLSESDLRSNEKVPDTEESVISSAAPAPAVATEKVETDDVHVQSQEVQA